MKSYNPPAGMLIEEPAAGHFVLLGHKPQSILDGKGRHIVPPDQCYISPEVPTEFLEAIIEERHVESVEAEEAEHPHKKRGRKSNAEREAAKAAAEQGDAGDGGEDFSK